MDAARYITVETLRDGRTVTIRSFRSSDRDDLVAAVHRLSDDSLRRRFFGVKRSLSDAEVDYFSNVDFVSHVALVALVGRDGTLLVVGGGRYVVSRPGSAEVAFAIVDDCQGLGIGSALMRHLIVLARSAGLERMTADVLADNVAMIRVFRRTGLRLQTVTHPGELSVTLFLS
jgi:ribosomal protein S18 acetylase RimI-like enzyme